MPHPWVTILLTVFIRFIVVAGVEEGDSSAIDFVSFKAILSSKIIHFSWDVESESKGDHFEIEKSIDEENWTLVSSVESLESHKERHTYKISEINMPEAPYEYFRVVRVDAFGKRTVLDVVNINQPILNDLWLLHVKGKINKALDVAFDSMICSDAELRLTDANGNEIRSIRIHIDQGHNKQEISIKKLLPGDYLITVTDEFGNRVESELHIMDPSYKGRTKF